jgi:eukaryotic-like serine/threonine-protein kinase
VSDEAKWQVTTAGGSEPRWRQDGNELFYFSRSNLMAVEVRTGTDSFKAGHPQLLFASPSAVTGRNRYVVTGDGRRFLINTVVDEERASPINVLVNWSAPNR